MRTRLLLLGALVTPSCGGQVLGNPVGFLDDGDAFHAPDGAIEFSPGSACAGYDATKFQQAVNGVCATDADCNAAVEANVPTNYPVVRDLTCPSGPRICAAPALSSNASDQNDRVPCTVGADGDAYCHAFYQQFVLGGADVDVSCQGVCHFSDGPNGSKICTPDAQSGACTPNACDVGPGNARLSLMVTRGDAGPQCEAPCVAP